MPRNKSNNKKSSKKSSSDKSSKNKSNTNSQNQKQPSPPPIPEHDPIQPQNVDVVQLQQQPTTCFCSSGSI
jgi:hypothetical protein